MALKAKKPSKTDRERFKLFLYGPSGAGKTIASIQLFPKSVIIDTERGCDHYGELIEEQGSILLQTNDIDEINSELHALLTEDHEYTSVIIDPVTKVYESIQERWDEVFRRQAERKKQFEKLETGDWGFGYWGKVRRDHKRMLNFLDKLDMNICMTAHQKPLYSEESKKIGDTFDAMKGSDYFFDNVFQLTVTGAKRLATTIKQRSYPERKFEHKFEWSAERVRKAWGEEEIQRKAKTVDLADPKDVRRVEQLCEILGVTDEQIGKWHTKANVEDFSEYTQEQIEKTLKWLESRLPKNEEVA